MTLHSVGENDPCPGHRSVTGDLISCDLPFGHRGVPNQVPYNWAERDDFDPPTFDPEPDQNGPNPTEEGSY